MDDNSTSTLDSSSIGKKRKAPVAATFPAPNTGLSKSSKTYKESDPRYYPRWDNTKPVPPRFFDCITDEIVKAHISTCYPARGDLGLFSVLPVDIITKVVNNDSWTRTRFLLCAGNRFLRFIAARHSDPRSVLNVCRLPEIASHCKCNTKAYASIARAAVAMDSPWVILRFIATAYECHNYASNRYAGHMAMACTELRCFELMRLELKFGNARLMSHRNYSVKGGIVMDAYSSNTSDMMNCLHACMKTAIDKKMEDGALELFSVVKRHNQFIDEARRDQGVKTGGNRINCWPDVKCVRSYLLSACKADMFTLARYLVTEHGATLANPSVIAIRPQAQEFYAWYKQNAPKHEAIPRPPKETRVPCTCSAWD